MFWIFLIAYHPYHTAHTAPYNPRLHMFGNVGILGKVHARVASLSTRVIDNAAYRGENMRETLAKQIHEESLLNNLTNVMELGIGVGMLTEELDNFGFNVSGGVDASPEMIEVAKERIPASATVWVENAADVCTDGFDFVVA